MRKIVFILVFLISSKGFSTERLDATILDEYLKVQKEFFHESCKPGVEETFRQLDKNYRGDGNFIPVLLDEKIDLKTVKNHLPVLLEKKQWIEKQIELISKIDTKKIQAFELDRIQNDVNLLVEEYKDYFFTNDSEKKKKISDNANMQFAQLIKEVEQFKNNFSYLISFKFPVNHLGLRGDYEKFKLSTSKEGRLKANAVYFYRKIVQDGTYDEDLSRNDASVRATFDSLYLSLTQDPNRSFLTENERVDFQFVVANYRKLLHSGPHGLLKRFTEWKERNDRAIEFYQSIVEGKKIKLSEDSQLKDVTTVLEDRSKSLYTLREFVLGKEAAVYEFWAKKSELFQALYAIETILYSEVGRLDAPDALERRDVAQVVINRSEHPSYNSFSSRDLLTKFISSQTLSANNKWLNVLFKEGEFSFTYFYFPGNLQIYCPDMSRVGQFLRRENVRIALSLLNNPRKDFKAVRYFSRFSMFGRIEMDSLWQNFKALEEFPGKPAKNSKKYLEYVKKDHYKFLYSFKNESLNKSFYAVEIKGKPFVIEASNPKLVYQYRNPHQFKYFTELK